MQKSIYVMSTMLNLLGIKHTNSFVEEQFLSSPHYPSLLAVSDTFEKFGANVMAVSIGQQSLSEAPLPCIVQINNNKLDLFYLLVAYNNDKAVFYNDQNKRIVQSTKMFLKTWTGVCLLVEKVSESQEPNIKEKLLIRNIVSFFNGILLLLLALALLFKLNDFLINQTTNVEISLLFLIFFKVLGLGFGILLMWYEVDKFHPKLQKHCQSGIKVDCEAVIGSDYAKIFYGAFRLSEIVFAYFFSTLCLVFLFEFSNSSLAIVGILSFVTLPIVFVSAYYQAFKLKKWCKFCLMVQLILLAELISILSFKINSEYIQIQQIIAAVILFLMPLLIWHYLRPIFKNQKEINLYKYKFQKLKNTNVVFESLLSESQRVDFNPENLGITLKNKAPKYHVLKICNPYCSPCAESHPVLFKLYNDGIIDLQIIFNAKPIELDKRFKPVSHLLSIYESSPSKISEALHDWYEPEHKEYDVFASKYPLEKDLVKQLPNIKRMWNWCNLQKVDYTPTVYVNGYRLTEEYRIDDLIDIMK